MKPLFTGHYCPRECDKEEVTVPIADPFDFEIIELDSRKK